METRTDKGNNTTTLTCLSCGYAEDYQTDKLHDLYDPKCGDCRAPQMGAFV